MIKENNPRTGYDKEKHILWQHGSVLLDEYRIESLLGEGGMGQVYLVTSLSTGYQYALKRCKLERKSDRRNFFAELQTWIDLPDHPNLVACRFFRTISDDIVIFSDFIDGGSLADLIQERRLNKIEDILDIAIQFAMGLHVIHEHGFIHQDVKPGNVLVTKKRIAKVSDFGLARARQFLTPNVSFGAASHGTLLVPGSGYMTPVYASPEQIAGKPLSRKSDVWSWAVSVFTIFTGGVTWQSGSVVGYALEQYLECGPADSLLPEMPSSLADLLRTCFAENPAARIPTLQHAADTLRAIYIGCVGRQYHQITIPADIVSNPHWNVSYDDELVPWIAPKEWLMMAMEISGKSPLTAARFITSTSPSLRSRALSDMAAYDEAMRIFEGTHSTAGPVPSCQYAALCIDKASVHEYLGDYAGAISLFDRALKVTAEISEENRVSKTVFVSAARGKARLLLKLGQSEDAFLLYRRILKSSRSLRQTLGQEAAVEIEVSARLGMAQIERERDRPGSAVSIYSEALNEITGIHNEAKSMLCMHCLIGRIQAEKDLGDLISAERDIASALKILDEDDAVANCVPVLVALAIHRAAITSARGAYSDAVAVLTEALARIEPLSRPSDGPDYREYIAAVQGEKAGILTSYGNRETALALYDNSSREYERLVREDGRFDLAGTLTKILSERALSIHQTGDMDAVISGYDKAVSILENLSDKHNDWRLKSNLAVLLMNKANALAESGNRSSALALFDRSIQLRKELTDRMPDVAWAMELAITLTNKSEYMLPDGMWEEAQRLCDDALALLEQARPEKNDKQWDGYLGWVKAHRAETIWISGFPEKAQREFVEALSAIKSALREVNSPRLRWLLEDAETVATRMANLS